jgi:hypothetical protein
MSNPHTPRNVTQAPSSPPHAFVGSNTQHTRKRRRLAPTHAPTLRVCSPFARDAARLMLDPLLAVVTTLVVLSLVAILL